jgi:hypothetical protein
MGLNKLLFALDPLGPLSPLNPRHPWNPLRGQVVARRPPLGALDEDHRSLLAEVYGRGALESLPFPNMEWWWNAVDLTTDRGPCSLISNVHLFALPRGWVVQGTVAVRDHTTRRSFQVTTTGMLDPGSTARFTASGWHLHRDPEANTYRIDVHQGDFHVVDLLIDQGQIAHFNDAELPLGWYDNNPSGNIPYWASYRSRFGRAESGSIRLPDGSTTDVLGGNARFDHQSIHWSMRDVRTHSPAVLGEALITRPKWLWYHLRVELESGETFNVMAYELRNGHTDQVLKRAVAIANDQGDVTLAEPDRIVFKPSQARLPGRVAGPEKMVIEFDTLDPKDPEKLLKSSLAFSGRRDQGFTVNYPVVGSTAYQAEEIAGDVSAGGRLCWAGQAGIVARGTGTLEVLDMVGSLTMGG